MVRLILNTCTFAAVLLLAAAACPAGDVLFEEDFEGELREGWRWERENPDGWRIVDEGLQIRIEPGNMWGGNRDAKNVLLRGAPDPAEQPLEVAVTIDHEPTEQYEQADLVWYYDDHHMVKLGPELVDGQLSVVMGVMREGRTRTLAIIPIESTPVRVRMRVAEDELVGEYRTQKMEGWERAGRCELPVSGEPKISLQCYQGPADAEHWATFSRLRVREHSSE